MVVLKNWALIERSGGTRVETGDHNPKTLCARFDLFVLFRPLLLISRHE